MSDELCIREALAGDLSFIFSSWLKSLEAHRRCFFSVSIGNDAYYRGHHTLLEHLLQKVDCCVAAPNDEPDIIIGWCAYERENPPVLHFTYVKQSFRQLGVARSLLKYAGIENGSRITATHMTPAGRSVGERMNLSITVNPYLALVA